VSVGGHPLTRRQLWEFLGRYAIWGRGAEVFHLNTDLDRKELLDMRRWQLAYLARYGRQSLEELRRMPIPMLNDFLADVARIVRAENASPEDT
jgi:hypothetical protein